jgi:hypothetical protein
MRLLALAIVLSLAARADTLPEDDALASAEVAAAPQDEPHQPGDPAAVICPEGAVNRGGHCLEVSAQARPGGAGGFGGDLGRRARGAADSAAPALLFFLCAALVLAPRRRRLLVAVACAAACGADTPQGFDDTEAPLTAANQYLNVSVAERLEGAGAALLLDHQEADPTRFAEPAAQLSLALHAFPGAIALRKVAGLCGDRVTTGAGTELLGYAAPFADEGTAELVQLESPEGCAVTATDSETIAALQAQGYRRGPALGHVWPPGWGEATPAAAGTASADAAADVAAPAVVDGAAPAPQPCRFKHEPSLFLFYSGVGAARNLDLLAGCPGEVVLGDKDTAGPRGAFNTAAAHAAGGRTAYVYSGFGTELLDLLATKGARAAADSVRAKLSSGYDYVVVDEITANPRWADTALEGKRFRQMLLLVPPRSVIGYISLDLTKAPAGLAALRNRRWLLRALRLRGKALALEVYLKTSEVFRGAAAPAFRTAAERVAQAVQGMPGAAGISRREITVLGLTAHSKYPQYQYLDVPREDLASIHRQVSAVLQASARTRAQQGLGFYFSGLAEIQPASQYTLDDLVARVHGELLRERR